MAHTTKKDLKPKLRFPKFRDEPGWKTEKAGIFFSDRKEAGEAALLIYSVTMHDGMVKRSLLGRKFDDLAKPAGNKKTYKKRHRL